MPTPRKGQMPQDPDVEDSSTAVVVVEEEDTPVDVVEDDDDVVEEVPPEDLDPATPLFEGGPNLGTIEAWKEQFGDVYVTSFGLDDHYVWRTMSRFEYRKLVKQLEQLVASGQVGSAEANMNNEEAICELCVMFPPLSRTDMASIPAGVASILSQEIMEASSFVALEVRQL